jgi:hypothetical protein
LREIGATRFAAVTPFAQAVEIAAIANDATIEVRAMCSMTAASASSGPNFHHRNVAHTDARLHF